SKNVKCCEQHTYRLPPSFLSTIHPQPRSTLFPYTTLFRSGRFHPGGKACAFLSPGVASGATRPIESVANTDCSRHSCSRHGMQRSEEHTSELQSRSDLVCRLLLEKKKILITFLKTSASYRY